MESQPSDSLKSPVKPQTSDQISSRTPKKLPHTPQRIKNRHRSTRLPEKYDMLLRFFDALDASLKLLRLRNSIPVFSKIRVMIENMSERRFTHQHLAQLKFLLPKEIGIKKILMVDETRCMKHDLHLTLTVSRMTCAEKRKRGSKRSFLRDHFISKLLDFVRDHPEGSEIPEEKLPEPFNQKRHDLLLNTLKPSSSSAGMQKNSGVAGVLGAAQPSHFPLSFKKHFSKRGSDKKSKNSLQSPLESTHPFQSVSALNPSVDRDELESVPLQLQTVPYSLATGQFKPKTLVDSETCSAHSVKKQETPVKSPGTPITPATPSLQAPKRFKSSADEDFASSACKVSDRSSCARSLQFGGPSRNTNIDLQVDDIECSNIINILPEKLLQSIKEKEKRTVELAKRKQMIKCLPKLFDRIYILFRNPKISAIRKEALVRDLTECHVDITDESEIEEQIRLMQEIIPEWIICKLSPSGNVLYRINKALDPNTLRQTLDKAM